MLDARENVPRTTSAAPSRVAGVLIAGRVACQLTIAEHEVDVCSRLDGAAAGGSSGRHEALAILDRESIDSR